MDEVVVRVPEVDAEVIVLGKVVVDFSISYVFKDNSIIVVNRC